MKKVILYTRVSTDEQAEKGFSLRHQKEQLEHYCNSKDYQIINHFQEDFSAKNFSARPEFNKLLRFVESNKNKIDCLLFTKWDRFSRNIEAAYRMIRLFREMGIEVNSIEQPLDLSQPDSKVMLAVYLVIPEVENDKNSLRTIDGMRKAMKEGCFMGKAPIGYLIHRNEQNKATLTLDNTTAVLIEKAFKMYAKGIYSAEEVRKKFQKKGLNVSRNGFLNLLKNPTYMGKIYLKPYKKEPELLVEGLHPAIIDEETFKQVQFIIKGKWSPRVRTLTEIDSELPLRGFLACPKCGKTLTGSGSKGRDGKNTYFYYHCTRYCGIRHKAKEVNNLFKTLLSEIKIEPALQIDYKSILKERFSERFEDKQTLINSLNRERENLFKRLETAEDHFFDKQIDVNTFNSMKNRIDNRLAEIKTELKELQIQDVYFEKHLRAGISFLSGIDKVYCHGDTQIKRKIIQTLFCKKLVFYGHYFATDKIEDTVKLILFREGRLGKLRILNH